MNKEKIITVELTKEELTHLINDTIAYIWKIKDEVFGKERATFGTDLKGEEPVSDFEKDELKQRGYFSRKELLDKLKKLDYENFSEVGTITQ